MNNFYTYIYLDKTKPGDFQYENLKFDYLPRYVGKGIGRRAYRIDEHKHHNISLSLIYDIEVVFIDRDINEDISFMKEIEYIKIIGRLDKNKGPLFNKTDGGDGLSGRIVSKETKENMSISASTRNIKRYKYHPETNPMYGLTGENNPSSKEYIIIKPTADILVIKGLSHFCRENGLNVGHLCQVSKGKHGNHKKHIAFSIPCILYQKQL